ncbi:MAG TPA: VOC family protein [Thermoleophilaceae bacterium]|nr:VOC family protein [Thermoleophilaceae bacterium]
MRTIPALPVLRVRAAAEHYREKFGFDPVHVSDDYAVVARDDAQLHLWGATDEEWRLRADLTEKPVSSGAESFLAGTASCRIEVEDVEALFEELDAAGVSHPTARGLADTDFGTREFPTVDMDGNLIVFFRLTS